jgi:hemoglobin
MSFRRGTPYLTAQSSILCVICAFPSWNTTDYLGTLPAKPVDRRDTIVTQTDPEKSLYQRLGGYDAIAAATDDLLLGRLVKDPEVGVYWKGKSQDSLRNDRQLIVDYLVEAWGGPAYYRGRDMKTSHTGLAITDREWEIFMRHTRAMLAHLEVPDRESQEVLGFLDSLKGDVVQPQPVPA